MKPMLEFIAKKKEGICQYYKEEKGEAMPDEIRNDPFAIFDIYLSNVSFHSPTTELDELRTQVKEEVEKSNVKDQEI